MRRLALVLSAVALLCLIASPIVAEGLEDVLVPSLPSVDQYLVESYALDDLPSLFDQREPGGEFLGELSANPYDADSVSNPYGQYGNPYGENLVNPFSQYGNPYGSRSWRNPYATDAPRIYAPDGTYLGELSSNPYDPDSIANPYGQYGSPYGNNLVNPFSQYGSPYGSQSWRNPYATEGPRIYASDSNLFEMPSGDFSSAWQQPGLNTDFGMESDLPEMPSTDFSNSWQQPGLGSDFSWDLGLE